MQDILSYTILSDVEKPISPCSYGRLQGYRGRAHLVHE